MSSLALFLGYGIISQYDAHCSRHFLFLLHAVYGTPRFAHFFLVVALGLVVACGVDLMPRFCEYNTTVYILADVEARFFFFFFFGQDRSCFGAAC